MKTPGKVGISLRFLRTLDGRGRGHLLRLFNRIWETGNFSRQCRESIIIPFLKSGKDARHVQSYRAISLGFRVFERIIMQRFTTWISARQPFYQNHFRFIPFRNFTVALTKLLSNLHNARENTLYNLLVTQDISGTNDLVEHDSLTLKLLEAGVDGHLSKWIHSFNAIRTFQFR